MRWELILHPESDYLEVKVFGKLDGDSMDAMAQETLAAMKAENRHNLFLDYTGITGMLGVLEIYERPSQIAHVGFRTQIKVGVLINDAYQQEARFWETVFRNVGFDFTICKDREAVLAYLAA